MDWEKVKAVLTELFAYFKSVFQYFGFIPADEAEEA